MATKVRLRSTRSPLRLLLILLRSFVLPLVTWIRMVKAVSSVACDRTAISSGGSLHNALTVLRSAQRPIRIKLAVEHRPVQAVIAGALYQQILEAEPPPHVLEILSHYEYPGDALRDLLEYCEAVDALYSRTAVLNNVPSFTGAVGEFSRKQVEAGLPGRLPNEGELADIVREQQTQQHGGPLIALLEDYWGLEHSSRFFGLPDSPADTAWYRRLCDDTRQNLDIHSMRAMLCHEIAVQGATDLLRSSFRADHPYGNELLCGRIKLIFSACATISTSGRLPKS